MRHVAEKDDEAQFLILAFYLEITAKNNRSCVHVYSGYQHTIVKWVRAWTPMLRSLVVVGGGGGGGGAGPLMKFFFLIV